MGVIAPASAPPEPRALAQSLEKLAELGFKPRLGKNARARNGFLAGTDRERAADVMEMFRDKSIRAIFCVRGGYGTARLLELLDYKLIEKHPKIFIGYSDITSLHCAFLKRAGLVTFHGPMLNSDINKPDFPVFALESMLGVLTQAKAYGSIRAGCPTSNARILRRGKASGRLIGGNLSILCATMGTPDQPSFKDKILFLEDLDEAPYRFDRMLTHLRNAGLLQQLAGVAIGVNANCEDPKAAAAREFRQSLEDVLLDRLLPLKIPVVSGLPFGHVPMNATLPVGVNVALDAVKGDLLITEAAVA